MSAPRTVRAVFEQLAAEGLAQPENLDGLAQTPAPVDETGSPWYLRLFVGLSAWIAAILFIVFLGMAEIIDPEDSGLLLGLAFCALAAGLAWWKPRSDFLGQLALALSLAGQILFVIGLASQSSSLARALFGDPWEWELTLTAIGLIILELVLLLVYRTRLHRLISALVIYGALLAILFEWDALTWVHGYLFLLAAGFVALQVFDLRLLAGGMGELAQPVTYATALFLLGLLLLPLFDEGDLDWRITALLLGLVLLALGWRVLLSLGWGLRSGAGLFLLAGCVLLCIPALRMPGILAALIVLLGGFWRGNRLLVGLAAVFLVFYVGAYYYSLEWTLLVKSLALMGAGVLLLALRLVMLRAAPGGAA